MSIFLRIFLISFIVCLCGCSVGNVPIWGEASAPAPESYVHEVRHDGESLSLIALWYTGEISHWQDIRRINPGLNVHRIRIGEKIAIPRQLLVKNAPLPKDFVRLHYANQRKSISDSEGVTFVNASSRVDAFQRLSYSDDTASSTARIQSALDNVYRVKEIKGCEKFENNIIGLEQCANIIEQRIGYNNLRY